MAKLMIAALAMILLGWAHTADRLVVWRDEGLVLLTPDGKEQGKLPGRLGNLPLNEPVVSLDGRRVAFTVNDDPPTEPDGSRRRKLFVRALDGRDPGRVLAVNALHVFWSADDLYAVEAAEGPTGRVLRCSRIDAATGARTTVVMPPFFDPFAATPDGKSFVGADYDTSYRPRKVYLASASRSGEVVRLAEIGLKESSPRISPDGRKILFRDRNPAEEGKPPVRLYVYDLDTKARTPLAGVPVDAAIVGYCWSPDGTKLAYSYRRSSQPHDTGNRNPARADEPTESILLIADADGNNPRTVLSGKEAIGPVDWR